MNDEVRVEALTSSRSSCPCLHHSSLILLFPFGEKRQFLSRPSHPRRQGGSFPPPTGAVTKKARNDDRSHAVVRTTLVLSAVDRHSGPGCGSAPRLWSKPTGKPWSSSSICQAASGAAPFALARNRRGNWRDARDPCGRFRHNGPGWRLHRSAWGHHWKTTLPLPNL